MALFSFYTIYTPMEVYKFKNAALSHQIFEIVSIKDIFKKV